MKKQILSMLIVVCMIASTVAMVPFSAFAAEETVTRGEWITALVDTFEMSVEEDAVLPDNYFGDIIEEIECYDAILLAVEFGVINLAAGENFYPDEPVTREFAAQTLNYCLNFQLEEDVEYTYSEADSVTYPDDIQVAVNRGWFALSSGEFLPDKNITVTEKDAMLADATEILAGDVISEDYDSKFEFAEDVIVVPEDADTAIAEDYTVTITDYDAQIKAGDIFVVFSSGIPVALKATDVTAEENVITITSTIEGAENAILSVESEGVAEIDLETFTAVEAETFSVTDTETNDVELMSVELQEINYDTKTKTLTATKDVKISSVCAGSISVELSNIELYYKESIGNGNYEAYITAKTAVTKTISFDFGSYVGLPNKITLGYVNIGGIGNISLDIDISLKGGMSETEEGKIMAGFAYERNDGFRLIKGYTKTSYSFTAEAEVKVGLTLSANIKLVFAEGRIWATVGVKGTYNFKDYTYVDRERPLQCETIKAYLYANVGVSVTINYIVDKKSWSKVQDIYTEDNSPVRVYYHYEDGELVDACTRGKTDNDTYTKYTTKTTSGYFNPAPSYSKGSYTNADGTTTTLWTYTLDANNNATITGYKGSASAIAIPSKIDGYTVTEIGSNAFKGNTKLRSVAIADSVTTIGNDVFYGCTNLSNVVLSKNVTNVGYRLFYNCKNLSKIEIPKSLTTVKVGWDNWNARNIYEGYGMFEGAGLTDVTFEEGITAIPANLFNNCANLGKVVIPDTVVEIGDNAFRKCDSLNTVKFSESLVKIEDMVFYGCGKLDAICLGESVTLIGESCFRDCIELKSIVLSDSIEKIKAYAFYNCVLLEFIDIPDSVTVMGENVFNGCTALEKVVLSNNYNEIPSATFKNCSSLKEIVFPETLVSIKGNAFENCTSLEQLDLPESLKTIDGSAFYGCAALTEITIPENVTSIGSSAFYNCDSLVNAEIKALSSIGASAFYDCDALTNVLIEGMGSIGANAFYDCDALESIAIGDKVTSIGNSMCYSCDKLTDIKLGKGITVIPDSAFRLCQSLESVTIPRFVKTIAANAFAEDTKLTKAYVPVSVNDIQTNSFSYPAKMTMYGKAGSYAEEYATGREMAFEAVNEPITTIFYTDGDMHMARYATVYPSLRIMPEFDTDVVTFASSDTSVATVSEIGAVYGKGYGTATIIATTDSGLTTRFEVTIVRPAKSIELNKTGIEISVGTSEGLVATLSPDNATDIIEWVSDNESVAMVDNEGLVTALKEGTATITAKALYGDVEVSCLVTVLKSGVAIVDVTGVEISKTEREITIGNTYTLSAVVLPENATNKLVEWSSSNENVAVVENGVVTAKSLGTATIRVKTISGGFEAECVITVVPKVEITTFGVNAMGAYGLINATVVNAPTTAKAYLVAYDAVGDIVTVQTVVITNGVIQTIVPLDGISNMKLMVWKEDGVTPLAEVKEITLK